MANMTAQDEAKDDARICLRVKNLPGVLSEDAVSSLLRHYGALHVKLLQDRVAKPARAPTLKPPQTAIATFSTSNARAKALARLRNMQLAGHQLRVDLLGNDGAEDRESKTGHAPENDAQATKAPVATQPPLPRDPPPPLPPPTQPHTNKHIGHSHYAPAPLAPHLGLHFASSPLLEYKYPKANEQIVRNIANALIALPKFYTQVLHLMNKMNLPTPFEENAIPGMFSKSHEERAMHRQLQMKRGPPVDAFTVEEEEEDDDEDAATEPETHKKQRLDAENTSSKLPPMQAQPLPKATVAVQLAQKFKRPAPSTSQVAKAFATNGSGFGSERSAPRPGVASEAELDRLRVPATELLHAAEIKSYIRGAPSNQLHVRNIAATVEKDDLLYVFGHMLPSAMDLSAICIELAAASGTATITYPTEAFATEALTKLHGVALESQPLVVSYAAAVETETNSPDVPMKIECDLPLRLSIADLDALRLKPSAFAEEKVMGKYQRGEPSTTLYVKNLAKDIQESELRAVFGAVLPVDTRVDTIKIRHFTEGRMKCQAFVEYPSVSLATLALDKIHGVVFKDKPLVVCFRKATTPNQ